MEMNLEMDVPKVCPFLGFSHLATGGDPTTAKDHSNSKEQQTKTFEAVLIRKDDIKIFQSKRDIGTMCALVRFIVKKFPDEWTAVTFWGSPSSVELMAMSLDVGDRVIIKNARSKCADENQMKYLPDFPSDEIYDVNENQGNVALLVKRDISHETLNLLRTPPVLQIGNVFSLGLLEANLANLVGSHVNFLGIVKEISGAIFVATRIGNRVQKCTLRVFDEHCSGMNVSIWGESNVKMAEKFVKFFSVVLFSGIRISVDNRDNSQVQLSTDSCSIMTPYPAMDAAHMLTDYLRSLVIEEIPVQSEFIQHYVNVRTVQEVRRKPSPNPGLIFSARVRCYLTYFDLDGPLDQIVTLKCSKCEIHTKFEQRDYMKNEIKCDNHYCPNFNQPIPILFWILSKFSDGSGSISIILQGDVAETLLGISADDFIALDSKSKTQLKWCWLMEEVEIVISIKAAEVDVYRKTLDILEMNRTLPL